MANPNKETLLAFQEVEKMRQHPERVKSYQSFGELLQEVQKQNESIIFIGNPSASIPWIVRTGGGKSIRGI